ncbi:hypothetical protein VT930_11915 [Mycobacterium sherrisii]|uniref:hypothetical protein n=1 Tax=Mycobacterium sherrisii TaxID=243061 RepID=UPI002DDD53CD|nr:hypothetical protein [Mycobacterium sherrisii]MEC4763810.1 hypothetical protein [Mycobacterium sherrisii]
MVHLAHVVSDEIDPDTGNNLIKESPAIRRKYQSLSQIGRIRGSSKTIHGPEFLDRVDTELHMSVADPTVFNTGDDVVLFPEFDENKEWIPGTGFRFVVDGMAVNSGTSPWPLFTKCLGGIVRIRRVT